ncbi:antitoxin of toxin-antitoxin stability system [Sphingobium sp. MK2]|uniref:antitoxin of toxin-antitoxin stability system n=1 Tax=Sphingobium sp. MK2 TaxID=3116540 RepID=UPI0032E3650E
MAITVTRTLYQYSELSEDAKETAKQWWLDARDETDYEYVIEDFVQTAAKLGITMKTRPVTLMGGGTRHDPCVWWSLGYCQSDYAAFDGSYSYAKGGAAAVKAYAPQDETLHAIADRLQAIQAKNFYGLSATINHHHYYGLQVETRNDRNEYGDASEEAESEVKEAMRDLCQWLYRQLVTQDEYLRSDEQITEAMGANEYTFSENGKREDP